MAKFWKALLKNDLIRILTTVIKRNSTVYIKTFPATSKKELSMILLEIDINLIYPNEIAGYQKTTYTL